MTQASDTDADADALLVHTSRSGTNELRCHRHPDHPLGLTVAMWDGTKPLSEINQAAADHLVQHPHHLGDSEEAWPNPDPAIVQAAWDALASGQDPAVLFDHVPDEFADWVRQVADRQRAQVAEYVATARADFEAIGPVPDRKSFAERALKSAYSSALFRLYDGRDIAEMAWKSIKPRGDTPFVTDEEG